jgi:hypothetical protein
MADKTVDLPGLGKTKSVYVWGALAVVTLIVGFAYYRHARSASTAAASSTDTAAAGPVDAEGYPIGSAQDIAYQESLQGGGLASDVGASATGALSGDLYYDPADGLYDLTSPYTGASGTAATAAAANSGPGTFTDNAYWTQYCIENVQGYSATQIQGAIAAVIAGQGLTTTQLTIWQNCVAVGGSPPTAPTVAPHLATQSTTSPGTGTGTVPAAPAGLTITGTSKTSWQVSWHPVTGATAYTFQISPAPKGGSAGSHSIGDRTSYDVGGIATGTTYTVHVAAVSSAGTGPAASKSLKAGA